MTESNPHDADTDTIGDATPVDPDFDAAESVLRLLVGGAVEGTHELGERLRVWEQRAREELANADKNGDPGPGERFRFLLIGMLFEGQAAGRKATASFMRYPKIQTRALSRRIDSLGGGFLVRSFLKPFIGGFKDWSKAQIVDFEQHIDTWVEQGRRQERQGRRVARLAATDLVSDAIERLAEHQALTELVQTQGVGLVGEFVDNVREVSVTADSFIEGVVRRVLRRPPRKKAVVGANGQAESSADVEEAA